MTRDDLLKCEEQRRAENEPWNEALECAGAGVQEEDRADGAAEERWDREPEKPPRERGQIFSESDHPGERTWPERGGVGRIRENRIASEPHERGEGDQCAAAGDRVDDAGDKRRGENDRGRYRSPSATYRSLTMRCAS